MEAVILNTKLVTNFARPSNGKREAAKSSQRCCALQTSLFGTPRLIGQFRILRMGRAWAPHEIKSEYGSYRRSTETAIEVGGPAEVYRIVSGITLLSGKSQRRSHCMVVSHVSCSLQQFLLGFSFGCKQESKDITFLGTKAHQ